MKRNLFFLVALSAIGSTAWADVRLPALFTDHMVLQQGQKNRVWGWADRGEEVIVTIAGQRHTAKADDKGKWQVALGALQDEALKAWRGRQEYLADAQHAFNHRTKCDSAAALGRYTSAMETESAVA